MLIKLINYFITTRESMKINLSLIGRPGSGKGTYGNLLSKALACPLVVMGDVLRKHVEIGTEIGEQVGAYQRKGKLADDMLVTRALLAHLEELHAQEGNPKRRFGFILDGFPRTLTQAKLLMPQNESGTTKKDTSEKDLVTQLKWPEKFQISFAVNIEVPDNICIEKMKGRRKCLKCNESFNVSNVDTPDGFFMPPKLPIPYPCRKCNMDSDWETRSDDTEEIFVRRMEEFHEQSAIVTQFYADQDKLVEFIPFKGIEDMPILEEIVNSEANSKILKL
jgi:adenylate kinase